MTSLLFVILKHLHTLRKNFEKSISFTIPCIKNPFTENVAGFDAEFFFGFQEEWIDLKKDTLLKLSFGELSVTKLWCQVLNEYRISYEEALKIKIPFPSLFMCEMRFSILAFMKDRHRNRLHVEHLMRLVLNHDFKYLSKRNGVERC